MTNWSDSPENTDVPGPEVETPTPQAEVESQPPSASPSPEVEDRPVVVNARSLWSTKSEAEMPNGSLVMYVTHVDDPGEEYDFAWDEDADKSSRYEQLDTWARDIHRKVSEGHALRPLPTAAE